MRRQVGGVLAAAMCWLALGGPARASAPTLVKLPGDAFVASAVATDPPYSADPAGRTDSTSAIQKAIDDVAALGGGVVFLPAGRYRLDGSLKLGYAVTLLGENAPPRETLLMACGAPGDTALIQATAGECGLIGLAIWYPNQRPDDVTAYPFAVSASLAQIHDLTLYNAFNGIELTAANGCVVANVRGTVLRRGIVAPMSGEFSWMHDVAFSNGTWRDSAARLGGAPMPEPSAAALDRYTRRYLVGLELGRLDGFALYGFRAPDAAVAVRIEKDAHANQHAVFGVGGVLARVEGPREEFGWDPWYYGMHYADLDLVPEAQGAAYEFARAPGPARRDAGSLLDVRRAPYGAVGDGTADDTAAIQRALEEAGRRGGGTVYLAQGVYKVTRPLMVPRGVELRGPLGVGKARSFRETCAIAGYAGRGAAEPETAPALITLKDHAGIRGLEIVYPEQDPDAARVAAYPFTIRGDGDGVWVVDTLLVNSYLGIDLASRRCDGHRVVGVWAMAFRKAVVVGGGSRGGKLERVACSYGPWNESGRVAGVATPQSRESVALYHRTHSVDYTLGTCEGESAWGLVGFDPAVHFLFPDDGGTGCTNAAIWQSVLDVARQANLQVDAGRDIRFYGLFATGGTGSGTGNWLETGARFTGPISVYAPTLQQTTLRHPYGFTADQVRILAELPASAGRAATSVPAVPGSQPEGAVDRDWRTAWRAPQGTWLQVDLGSVRTLRRFLVEGGRAAQADAPVIRQAELWTSLDGRAFTLAGTLQTWGQPWADRPVEPVRARYVRLRVTAADGAGPIPVSTFAVY